MNHEMAIVEKIGFGLGRISQAIGRKIKIDLVDGCGQMVENRF